MYVNQIVNVRPGRACPESYARRIRGQAEEKAPTLVGIAQTYLTPRYSSDLRPLTSAFCLLISGLLFKM